MSKLNSEAGNYIGFHSCIEQPFLKILQNACWEKVLTADQIIYINLCRSFLEKILL